MISPDAIVTFERVDGYRVVNILQFRHKIPHKLSSSRHKEYIIDVIHTRQYQHNSCDSMKQAANLEHFRTDRSNRRYPPRIRKFQHKAGNDERYEADNQRTVL